MKNRRIQSLLLAALTILCGLLWRLAPLHLAPFAFKYGGSALYAINLYWLLAAAAPRARTTALATAAVFASTAIELLKLVRNPSFDAFRLTLPGKLLLGRFFSVGALIAYTIAVVIAALLDHHIFQPHQRISGSKLE